MLITARDEASAGWIHDLSLDDINTYLYIANPNDPVTYPYHFDVTRWTYDPATGLCTGKAYPDGAGPSYTYTPAGRLLTRTWARGVTTAYTYNALGQLAGVDYSDATPDASYTYDRLGRRLTASTAGKSSSEYVYSGLDLATETQNGEVIAREADAFGRPRTLSLSAYGFPRYTSETVYDPLSGRPSAVQTHAYNGSLDTPLYADQRFAYAYLPGSDLPQSVAGSAWYEAGAQWTPALTTTRAYEPARDLVSAVTNLWDSAPVSAFAYANDALGRRTARADSDGSVVTDNSFGYNLRSEVQSALMGTNAYAYVYDPIGNRLTASANADTNFYAANALNQYSNITYQSNSLQPDSLSPAYDLDGNMLTNGPWAYTWDAENRMASACSNGVLLVTNVYDHLSRRIRKEVYARADPTCNYEPVTCNTFLYDGWNVIRETALLNSLTPPIALTNYYTWGLDLSGSLQGAGGVGGLLAVTSITSQPGTSQTLATFYPCYDANGNVTAYLDATGGVARSFSYDPFGRTVSETVNALPGAVYLPHRFSTKYLDPETGLYYYGYRFYHPELGRWVNRDPIGEEGGANILEMGLNDLIDLCDINGLTIRAGGGIVDHGEVSQKDWDSLGEAEDCQGLTVAAYSSAATCLPCKSHDNMRCFRFTISLPVKVFGTLKIKPKCARNKLNPTGYRTVDEHEHMHARSVQQRASEMIRAMKPLPVDKCVSEECCKSIRSVYHLIDGYITNEEIRFTSELDYVDYPEGERKEKARKAKKAADQSADKQYYGLLIAKELMNKKCALK